MVLLFVDEMGRGSRNLESCHRCKTSAAKRLSGGHRPWRRLTGISRGRGNRLRICRQRRAKLHGCPSKSTIQVRVCRRGKKTPCPLECLSYLVLGIGLLTLVSDSFLLWEHIAVPWEKYGKHFNFLESVLNSEIKADARDKEALEETFERLMLNYTREIETRMAAVSLSFFTHVVPYQDWPNRPKH